MNIELEVTKQKDGPTGMRMQFRLKPVEDSVVLAERGPEIEWSSSSIDNRIASQLRVTRSTGLKTRADIHRLVNDDGHGSVSRYIETVLAKMVDEGRVLATKVGATMRYELNDEHPQNQVPG